MAPLDNPRHEAYVQNLADPTKPTFLNQSKSYEAVYKPESKEFARTNASRLMNTNDNVKKRFSELLNQYKVDDASMAKVMGKFLHDADGNIAHKFLRTGLEAKGYIGTNIQKLADTIATQVNIVVKTEAPNSNDTK